METTRDYPKSLGDPAVCAARLARIEEPHVSALTEFVTRLKRENPTEFIPYFDPWDGGVAAEVLYLLEAPGRKATHFVSRNNPDETAKNMFCLNAEAGIPRKRTVTWNAVPWYIGDARRIRAARPGDVRAGLEPLFELLTRLPDLRAVVLLGRKAESNRPAIEARRSDLRVFVAPHPSPLFCNRSSGNRQRILDKFHEVAAFLGPTE